MSGKKTGKTTSADLIARFLAPAMKIKDDKVLVCRADPRIVFVNVRHGVESVFGAAGDPERPDKVAFVEEALPKLHVKWMLSLPELARAVMLAAQKVAPPVSSGEIDKQLAVVRELREPILSAAEVLAGKGLLPRDQVAKIRKGSGKYDMASDGVALADLFTEHHAAIAGKHPFTEAELETMRTASEWLLDHLKPVGTKVRSLPKTEKESLRDRLWTLLVQRHSELRVAGHYLFRDDFDDKTPKLLSRAKGAKTEEPVAGDGESAPADGTEGQDAAASTGEGSTASPDEAGGVAEATGAEAAGSSPAAPPEGGAKNGAKSTPHGKTGTNGTAATEA